ncbi:MAG: hypothetical protein MUC87_16310 [Bacteroidia bacterium]|jgi:hypothetical protein|nr:hypothetical protein [Bacteroidia bacterium]
MKQLYTLSAAFTLATAALSVDAVAQNPLKGGMQYIGPAAGFYVLPIASLNSQIMQSGFSKGFDGNAMYIGLDRAKLSHVSQGKEFNAATLLTFHYLLPQTISDSSREMTLGGWNMQYDGSSFDFISSRKVVFTAGLGWTWGRTKIVSNDAAGETVYTNPYFIPMVRSELSFTLFERVTIGARAAYRHDWSKTGWRRKSGNGGDLPGTRLSGGMYGAFIAFTFGKADKEETVIDSPPPAAPGQE